MNHMLNYESDNDYDDDEDLEKEEDEEEEEGSDEDEKEKDEEKNEKRKVKKGGDPRYALPTADEQRAMRQTAELMTSNILSLETTELLSEVKPSYKASIENYLRDLHGALMSIEANIVDVDNVPLTFGLKLHHTKDISLDFLPPTKIDVIGSFLLRSMSKPNLNIDMAVSMPSECFLPKDYLNYRYFDKRNLYVYAISKHLSSNCSHLYSKMSIFYLGGDEFKPCLEIVPMGVKNCKHFIRIIPVIDSSIFALSKLAPDRNNVRRRTNEDLPQPATPMYNSCILEDMFMKHHLTILHSIVLKCPSFADSIILVKVWNTQRVGFSHKVSCDDFNGFLLSMILASLFQSRSINPQMNAMQIFKIFLEKLSTINDEKKIHFSLHHVSSNSTDSTSLSECPKEVADNFKVFFDVNLIDSSGWYNLAFRITSNALANIKHEAIQSLKSLSSDKLDSFENVFMTPVNFWNKFDQYVTLPLPEKPASDSLNIEEQNALCDHDYYTYILRATSILSHKALGDRALLIRCVFSFDQELPIPINSPSSFRPNTVVIGILLAGDDAAGRRIDKGPAADDADLANEFRAFWGSKSELRRFKDGTITETLMWSGDKHTIPGTILKYILGKHIPSIVSDSISVVATQLDPWLVGGTRLLEETASLTDAFNALSSDLKGLTTLPMGIREVNCTSSAMRYTSLTPVLQHPLAGGKMDSRSSTNYVSSVIRQLDVVLTFTANTKWPDKLEAITAIKSALYLKIGESLENKGEYHAVATKDSVVIYAKGYAFNCTIYHNREMGLLEATGVKDQISLSHQIKINCEDLVVLSSALLGFHWKNASFNSTARLAKRWLSAHMLSPHFSEECIELMVAHLFLSPLPLSPPSSALIGFHRFLHLLSTFSWKEFPLVVDLNNDISSEDHHEIEQVFSNYRSTSAKGGCIMYILTGFDKSSGWKPKWTLDGPDNTILSHTTKIAAACLNILQKAISSGLNDEDEIWVSIFTPSLKPFDLFLVLNESVLLPTHDDEVTEISDKRGKHYRMKIFKNLINECRNSLLVGFNPMKKYFLELNENYGHLGLFFYDEVAGDRIGVVWKPSSFMPKDFSVASSSHAFLIKDKKITLNIASLLADIKASGDGIIKSIILA